MYKIKFEIKEPIVPLYGPEEINPFSEKAFETMIGVVKSSLEFAYIRSQIKQNNLNGYYIVYNDQKLDIASNGRLYEWPDGLYDQYDKLLDILLE